VLLVGQGLDEGQSLQDELAHRHGSDGQAVPAGLDAGQVQDFVDQPQEVVARPHHLLDVLQVRGREGVGGVGFHELGKAQDGIHGRAQLVAHVGQEPALRQVRLLDPLIGVRQFRVLASRSRVRRVSSSTFRLSFSLSSRMSLRFCWSVETPIRTKEHAR